MSRLIDANEVVKEILAERDKIPRTVPIITVVKVISAHTENGKKVLSDGC